MATAGAVFLQLFQDRGTTEEKGVADCPTMLHDGWQETVDMCVHSLHMCISGLHLGGGEEGHLPPLSRALPPLGFTVKLIG